MSDTKVYEPHIRTILGIASHFCEVAALKSRTAPNCTTRSLRILHGTVEGGVSALEHALARASNSLSRRLDSYKKSPDSSERQYKSRTWKGQFGTVQRGMPSLEDALAGAAVHAERLSPVLGDADCCVSSRHPYRRGQET